MERIAWLNYETIVFKYVVDGICQAFLWWTNQSIYFRRQNGTGERKKCIVSILRMSLRFVYDWMLRVIRSRQWQPLLALPFQYVPIVVLSVASLNIDHEPNNRLRLPLLRRNGNVGANKKIRKPKAEKKKPVDSTENMSELNNVLSITIRHSEFQRNPNWKWKRTWTADSNSRATMMY